MKIGIIGSGEVAKSLGMGFIGAGHQVMLGSRDPHSDELIKWRETSGMQASTGTTSDTAAFGDIAVLAVAWHAAEDILQQVRPQLASKVVLDVTNPLELSDNEPPKLSIGHMISGGEMVQQSLPDSHVVKTLNIINHTHMVNPSYQDGTPSMLMCGNNGSAKQQVRDLLIALGWSDITDLGDISKSRLMEPLCMLWVVYGMVHQTWDHAFSILKK